MEIRPSYDEVREIIRGRDYSVVPLCAEVLSDFITPIEAIRKLQNISSNCYMFESAEPDNYRGRYTFLGYDPRLHISCTQGEMRVGDVRVHTDCPSDYIRDVLGGYTSPVLDGMPPFTGGLVGYFAYDYMGYIEPSTVRVYEDEEELKDVDLMLYDKVIVFDNLKHMIMLISNMYVEEMEAGYNKAVLEIEHMRDILLGGARAEVPRGRLSGEVSALFTREEYVDMVDKAKNYIKEGDIFQVVLSNRLSAKYEGSLLDTYRVLRTINPSPYMFYMSRSDIEIAGASPETLVRLKDGELYTFPLAGTRRRGEDDETDRTLERELLADEKEIAEHNMLVDLGRNDLGKVSRFGSVAVEKLREVIRFSHVMHIGSTVRGELREECDALDAIEAVLPAGTLSGAPKIRACQIIGDMERTKRGIYGGALGYIDFSGNMDMCIAIRLVYKLKDRVYVRSGAGIVADSVPEAEYEECINKAKAVLSALEKSQEVCP